MSMMRQRGLLLATLLLAVLAAGCADVPLVGRHERTTAFDDATDNYGKMLRWGYFEEAAKYLRAQDGSAIVQNDPAAQIQILLNGAANGAMPAWRQLSDTEIAAVITYTKNSWSNQTGKLVQPAEIVAARK